MGEGENHPGLSRPGLFILNEELHWLRQDYKLKEGETAEYMMRIRYRQPLFKANLTQLKNGLLIAFEEEQKAVSPGQFAAWYKNDELIGSGVIQ